MGARQCKERQVSQVRRSTVSIGSSSREVKMMSLTQSVNKYLFVNFSGGNVVLTGERNVEKSVSRKESMRQIR